MHLVKILPLLALLTLTSSCSSSTNWDNAYSGVGSYNPNALED